MFPWKRLLLSLACIALGGLVSLSWPQDAKKKSTESDQSTIKVAVEMVSLPVVVTTREGKRITDLKKEDFEIYEDGVLQTISGFAATDEPISLVLALDTSGSTELKLARIQNEAITFVNLLHPDDSVAVLSFAQDVTLQKDFSIDREKNEVGIKQTRPGGWTVLYEAVWLALEEVLKPVQERKALVLFTDGMDTASHKVSQKETLDLAKETQATIYCIYFNTEGDAYLSSRRGPGGYPVPGTGPVILNPYPPVYGPGTTMPGPGMGGHGEAMAGRNYLKNLAEYSGGVVVDALEMDDLSGAFEQIAKELASQFSIGYYSTNQKHDGKFRKVEVKVKKPGLVARTKKGYLARKDKK